MTRKGRPSAAMSAWWIVTIDGWCESCAMRFASTKNRSRVASSIELASSTLTATERCGRSWRYSKTSAKPPSPSRRTYSKPGIVGGVDAYAARLLPRERQLLRVLMRAIEQWPRLSLSSTARFSTLDVTARQQVLRAFEDSSLTERRLLGTLLRGLVGMPLFDDPRFLAAIGHKHGCGLQILP